MKTSKRLLACVLSLIMAISCFAVVPVMAEELKTYDGITGVTLVNQKLHDNYDSSKITFDQVAAKIKATVSEKYASDANTLQISDLTQANYATFVSGKTNLTAAANSIKYQSWAAKDTTTWTSLSAAEKAALANGAFYDASANSTDTSGIAKSGGTTVEYDNSVKGADRLAVGGYDYLLTADLGTNASIDALTLMGHVRTPTANSVYKIYVGNDRDTLYTDANEVFYYNQHDVYTAYMDSVTLNGVYSEDKASAVAKMSQGAWLEFGGETKPYGRFVGVKIIDSDPGAVSTNWLQVYELGIFGDPAITHLDTSYDSTTKTWAEKYDLISADLTEGYKANLQLSNMKGSAIADKVKGETDAISNLLYQYPRNGGQGDFSSDTLTKLTDLGYYGYGSQSSWGTPTLLDSSGYNSKTYANYGDSEELFSTARVEKDRYDMLITVTLDSITAVDKFFLVSHPNARYAITTYAVYVGNDKDTLYNAKNQVFYYDAYNIYKNEENTYKFNGGTDETSATVEHSRGSETQYIEFTGDNLPTGKYVGIKIYDAATIKSSPGWICIYDIGVYGDSAGYSVDDYVSHSIGSTSALDVVSIGNSGGTTVLNEGGNEVFVIKAGETYTFKADPVTDSRHTFLGWFNGDQKVSEALEYTAVWNGESLVAKYSTDLIFLMTPGENVAITSAYTNCNPQYGSINWVYDADEMAMKLVPEKRLVTVQGDNPDTEEVETSYQVEQQAMNSALMTAYTIDGKDIYTTKFEPWTTYKYSITIKATGGNISGTVGANGMNFQNQTKRTGYIEYDVTKNSDYVTYDFYFNSGAADYTNGSTRATSHISNNLLNIANVYAGTTIYIKEMSIEKVNTLMTGNVANATVTPYGTFKPHLTDQASIIGNDNNTVYGGLTKANEIVALVYGGLEADGVIGAADNGKAMFTVEAEEGYEITAVKVNGNAVTADENGVYTYVGAAVDDGIDHAYLRADNKAYIIDVETTAAHVHTEETVKGYDATCTEPGLTDGVICSVCEEILTEQETIGAKGHDMQLNDDKTALVCANGCGEETPVYVVTFVGKDSAVLYEAIVEVGNKLSNDDISAAKAKVPAIYGYTFTGDWDKGTDEEIASNTTYTAIYNKNEVKYTVTINYASKDAETYTDLSYDAKLSQIYDSTVKYWTVNGVIFAYGSELTLYVAGDMEITGVAEEAEVAAGVSVVHDEAVANENDNTYATFARVINPENKVVKEVGFIYVTGTTYGTVGDDGFTMAGLAAANKKYDKGTISKNCSDFMISYNGITNQTTVKRYARAYVIFEGDDTVYYSNVVSKTFNEVQ